MPTYKFKRTEITTETEIRNLANNSSSDWLPPLVAILYLVGCRITEALNLRRRNIWLEEKALVIEIGVLKRRDTKKGPYENVPHLIHVRSNAPFVKDMLWPYVESIEDRERHLFPSPRFPGRHLTRQLAWKELKKGIQNISPHVFRHDRLMKLAMRGASEAQLMDWAGWTDARPAGNYIRATGRLAAQLSDSVD